MHGGALLRGKNPPNIPKASIAILVEGLKIRESINKTSTQFLTGCCWWYATSSSQ
jgi:hypothetical protein